jgi:hypothetical protein
MVATPALALFCRVHSTQPWLKKQIFASSMFARRMTSLPPRVVDEQTQGPLAAGGQEKHPRVLVDSWNVYRASAAAMLVRFILAVGWDLDGTRSDRYMGARKAEVVFPNSPDVFPEHRSLIGSRWALLTEMSFLALSATASSISSATIAKALANPFGALYVRESSDSGDAEGFVDARSGEPGSPTSIRCREFVMAFRGGDGGSADAKAHPGSPARSFCQGEKIDEVPWDVMAFAEILAECANSQGAGSIHDAVKIRVIGYSLGGIPAIGTYLLLRELLQSRGARGVALSCTLLNTASAFWPYWLYEPGVKSDGAARVPLAISGRGAGFPGLLRQDWWYSSSTGEADFRDVTAWVIKHDPLSESAEDTSLQAPQLPGVTNVLPHMSESAIENHELKWFL